MITRKKPLVKATMSSQFNLVFIGGGKGIANLLTGFKKYPCHLTAMVGMADSGSSSGELRKELGILPPGGVRRCLVALSETLPSRRRLFNWYFKKGRLKNHNLGNLIIAALWERENNPLINSGQAFEKAIKEVSKILKCQGEVIPITLDSTQLYAQLINNKIISGEHNIDVPRHNGYLKIKKVFLRPKAKANPKAMKAILKADLIIIGPGDLYSSLIQNFLVNGIKEAVNRSLAKKVYICNLMTKFGETNHFNVFDFVEELEKYLLEIPRQKNILDYVIYNTGLPSSVLLRRYKKEKAELVSLSHSLSAPHKGSRWSGKPQLIGVDCILEREGELVHHPQKIAKLIWKLLK